MLLTRDQIPPDLEEFFEPAECGECFVCALVGMFREVRRALRDDGTVWLNLGDSYNAYNGNRGTAAGLNSVADQQRNAPERGLTWQGAKPKDLLGIPWMVAFALRADGWYLRSDIVWSKPNPMPESVTDRPTKSHEYLFLLSKGPRYFYDADAIREPADPASFNSDRPETSGAAIKEAFGYNGIARTTPQGRTCGVHESGGRNKRSVWTVATQPYPGAHFATFPPKLIEPCILAGSPPKCCGVCGAPWRRVVEREGETPREKLKRFGASGYAESQPHNSQGLDYAGDHNNQRAVHTVGWEPSCAHHDDTGKSVVLDPFAGSGTTGAVTLEHGRAFIGIELNPKYAELIRERLLGASLRLEGFGAA